MPSNPFLRVFSSKSGKNDVEIGTPSTLKNRFFKSQNKSLTSKTSDIEGKIVQHLARFASVPTNDVFALMPPSRPTGLFADEVSGALSAHGRNVLSSTAPVTPLVLLLRAAFNPFNILLSILAIISIATGDKATFSIMVLMVVISSGLRFWQEHKSLMKATRLVSMVSSTVRVLRHPTTVIEAGKDVEDECEVEIERSEVVPGDVIVVASGDMFPGDVVVLFSNSLLVSQSALTGEVLPVEKSPYSEFSPFKISSASDLISAPNVCLAGTSVLSGSGRALVVSTGDDTYLASIAEVLRARRPRNAFQNGIRKVSYLLLSFMAVMTIVVLVIKGTTSKDWRGAFLFCIAVAVGLTPELLPMIVTSNLALSAVRMSAKKVIVKQLEAILNLGGTTVLCCDKTGTLTQDRVVLHSAVDGAGAPSHFPLELAYLNAYFQMGTRSFLDAAILAASSDTGGDALEELPQGWTRVFEIPFDSTRRMLSVVLAHTGPTKSGREGMIITKGAAEEVLERCTKMYEFARGDDDTSSDCKIASGDFVPGAVLTSEPIDEATRSSLASTAETLNSQGLRVIAVATKLYKDLPSDASIEKDDQVVFEERDLVFVGFLAFLDPPKPDAADAIKRLQGFGVKVLVLTGDAPTVAAKVAMDIGIIPSIPSSPSVDKSDALDKLLPTTNGVITGSALSAISGDQAKFRAAVQNNIIFAKLSPYMKLQIVEELRKQGHNVAFLGDGVNDTMALRGADVGISVHSGTEVAKDAADIILLEKSLGVIADGVLLGRRTLVNTLKYIKMATSSNFGNVFSIVAASAWLPYNPMSPLQLLVQNLLYDFSQASIPWDNVDTETLQAPRNWDEKSIMRFMFFFGPTSSVFDICIFSLNWFKYGIRTIDSPLVKLAQTHWFLEGLLTQTFIVYFLRTAKIPFLQSSPSRSVLLTTAGMAAIGISFTYIPKLNSTFNMTRPDPVYGGYLCAVLVGYMILVQCVKLVYVRLFHEMI